MRNYFGNIAPSLLAGVAILLLAGCMGGDPGTGKTPAAEIRNINSALEKSKKINNPDRQIDLLRKSYEAANSLKTRWPEATEIEPFLAENKIVLSALPQRIYALALENRDMASLKWALEHSAQVDPQYMSMVRFWKLGPKWQELALAEFPEHAMPVFMEQALQARNRKFFYAHAEAYKTRSCNSNVLDKTETTEFNVRYCGFLAKEFDRAVALENNERIAFMLDHAPPRTAAPVMDPTTEASIKALGDYIFYSLKDEDLAGKLVELRYPLNRIDLEKTGFSPEFTVLLKNDLDYAVSALQLDEWHGPLSKTNTIFLLSLPPQYLAKVDKTYINETIDLCLSRSKTTIAIRLIKIMEKTGTMTKNDYNKLVALAVRHGNTEIFEYIYKQNDEMDIYDADLLTLATNYRMFTQYAPRILTYHINQESRNATLARSVDDMVNEVVTSTNHSASAFLIQKYDLHKTWKPKPDGRTLLMDVCEAGNLPAAKYLIERTRADIEATTTYSGLEMSLFGRSDPVEGRLSAIHYAAKSGNAALIKYLASKNAEVNARTCYGVTPLMYAVSNGHYDAARMLILLEADVNARMDSAFAGQYMPERGSFEQLSSAYRRAVKFKQDEILELLKEAGARP